MRRRINPMGQFILEFRLFLPTGNRNLFVGLLFKTFAPSVYIDQIRSTKAFVIKKDILSRRQLGFIREMNLLD